MATSNKHTKHGGAALIRHFGLSMSVTTTEYYHPTVSVPHIGHGCGVTSNITAIRYPQTVYISAPSAAPSTLCHSFLCCYSQSPPPSPLMMPGNSQTAYHSTDNFSAIFSDALTYPNLPMCITSRPGQDIQAVLNPLTSACHRVSKVVEKRVSRAILDLCLQRQQHA